MATLKEQKQVIKDLTEILGVDVKRLYAAITSSLVAEQLSSVDRGKRDGLERDIANQLIYFEVLKNYIGVDQKLLNQELNQQFEDYKRWIGMLRTETNNEPAIGSSVLGADLAGAEEPSLSESLEELEKNRKKLVPEVDDKAGETMAALPFEVMEVDGPNDDKMRVVSDVSIEDKSRQGFDRAVSETPHHPI